MSMLYPAMNKLTEYIPNRYMMVNVVARRARQVAAQRGQRRASPGETVTMAIGRGGRGAKYVSDPVI